jgi:hypothetical protein
MSSARKREAMVVESTDAEATEAALEDGGQMAFGDGALVLSGGHLRSDQWERMRCHGAGRVPQGLTVRTTHSWNGGHE